MEEYNKNGEHDLDAPREEDRDKTGREHDLDAPREEDRDKTGTIWTRRGRRIVTKQVFILWGARFFGRAEGGGS